MVLPSTSLTINIISSVDMFTEILMMVNDLLSSNLLALEAMERIGFIPDVLHAHDYHYSNDSVLVKRKIQMDSSLPRNQDCFDHS